MEPLLYLLGIAVLIAGSSYFVVRHLDGKRMKEYFAARGETLISFELEPFGPGWFGERDSRIFSIRYRDRDQKLHAAFAKTSMFSGVYLTEDRVIELPDAAEVQAKLRAGFAHRNHVPIQTAKKPKKPWDATGDKPAD